MQKTLTIGEYVSQMLALNGIDTVFGIPGVHTLEMYRGIAHSSLRHVLVRHEQGAGFAADGYARLTGRPAVAMVISGPGLTNILTPLGQAYTDSVPVFVVASTAARHSLGKQWGALHELKNQRAIAENVTGHAGQATSAHDVRQHLKLGFAALRAARPRPAYLEIPIDVLGAPCELPLERFPLADPAVAPAADAIASAAALIKTAKSPLIIAGGGTSHAGEALRRLAERLDAPCVLTTAAKGVLPERHPLNVGAALAYAPVHEAVAAADVVIAVGTELAETDHYLPVLPFGGRIVRIDVDPVKLADQYANDVPVLGDARATLELLDEALAPAPLAAPRGHGQALAARLRGAIRASLDDKTRLLYAMVEGLRAGLPDDGVVYSDMTQIAYAGNCAFETSAPRTWFHPSGYGTLGYALPAAVGGKIAEPGRAIVALAGDFGVQFTLHELMTAVEARQNLPIVVWNNDALGQIRDDMIGASIPPTGVIGLNPDFPALARAYGALAAQARSPAELTVAVKAALAADRPTLIELRAP